MSPSVYLQDYMTPTHKGKELPENVAVVWEWADRPDDRITVTIKNGELEIYGGSGLNVQPRASNVVVVALAPR